MKKLLLIVLAIMPILLWAQTDTLTSDSIIVEKMREKGVTFSHDNSVTLLMSGQEKFDDMFEAIRQAKSSIHLEYFNLTTDL